MERDLDGVSVPLYVIPGQQDCSPAIWLRVPFKIALINESAPILHSSPMILIKSRKIYTTGRLVQGPVREFVRMGRMVSIRKVKFEAGQFPAQFVLMLYVCKKHVTPSRSLYHQATSNVPIHTGRRQNRGISVKYLHSVKIGTEGSN